MLIYIFSRLWVASVGTGKSDTLLHDVMSIILNSLGGASQLHLGVPNFEPFIYIRGFDFKGNPENRASKGNTRGVGVQKARLRNSLASIFL